MMDMRSLEFAHDLKTPIQLIYSCAQLLEMELLHNARAEEYLKMLVRSADQLQTMVRNVLDESRLCESGADLRVSALDVVAEARTVARECALLAGQRRIDLRFHSNAAAFRMATDAEKLRRILHNLLSNALRFTPAGGRVELDVQLRGDAVDFIVSDNGCGIAHARQKKVFERGETDGGDGYGLSIVREYATLLGGGVQLQSAPGRGSQFTVHLPTRSMRAPA